MDPEKLLYARTHEWVAVETDKSGAKIATVGLSAFAVKELTDLVFLELPKLGRQVTAGQPFGEVESVKAVSDLYSPVDGQVVAVNAALPNALEQLSSDPFGKGWIAKIKVTGDVAAGGLMDFAAYQKLCAEEEH